MPGRKPKTIDTSTPRGQLASRIQAARLAAGMTQPGVCERTGLNRQTYSKWETGATSIDAAALPRIAAALGVQVADLFGDVEPMPMPGLKSTEPAVTHCPCCGAGGVAKNRNDLWQCDGCRTVFIVGALRKLKPLTKGA